LPKPPDVPVRPKPMTIAQGRGVLSPTAGPGRPSKLTAKIRHSILDSLRRGNYLTTAADVAGISISALREGLARGEREKSGPYRDFLVAVRQVSGIVEDNLVGVFQGGAENDPTIAKEFLARRWPQRWGAKVNGGEQTVGPIVPIQIIFRTLPPGYDPVEADKAAALEAEGGVVEAETAPAHSGQGSLAGFVEPQVAAPPPIRVSPPR